MFPSDSETFGPLLHGVARAWRLKLDQRLRPIGLSQAKWRTLLHLSRAKGALTQSEVAARLDIEEPTLVNLLHRLERAGWVERKAAAQDRRSKTVQLGRRAHHAIQQINATAAELRHELLADIPPSELRLCMLVLERVRKKAEQADKISKLKKRTPRLGLVSNGDGADGHESAGKKSRSHTA